jgi:hypothetical protein
VIAFALADAGDATTVTVSPDYKLRFGPFGHALDRLAVRRRYAAGIGEMLAGLKRYVETGERS